MDWGIVLTVILFIMIVLQITYIRAKLAYYDEEKYKILSGLEDKPKSATNTVKAYGLSVDKRVTGLMNDAARFDPGFDLTISDNLYVNCNDEPKSKDVYFRGGSWVALRRNDGCSNLVQDVLTKQTRYVVIDNVVYIAHFDPELNNKLRDSLAKFINHSLLTELELVHLVDTRSQDVEFVDPDSKCDVATAAFKVFRLHPPSPPAAGNLLSQIQAQEGDGVQLIVIGFSTA